MSADEHRERVTRALSLLRPHESLPRRYRATRLLEVRCPRGHLLANVYSSPDGPLLVMLHDGPLTRSERAEKLRTKDLAAFEDGGLDADEPWTHADGMLPDEERADLLAFPGERTLDAYCRCGLQLLDRAQLLDAIRARRRKLII
jgi:hypothetical protein